MKKWKERSKKEKILIGTGVTIVGLGIISLVAIKFDKIATSKLNKAVTNAMKGNVLDTLQVGKLFGKMELSIELDKSIRVLREHGYPFTRIGKLIVENGVEYVIDYSRKVKIFRGGG